MIPIFSVLLNGGKTMKVEIRIDPGCTEQNIIIHTDRLTPEIEALARSLQESASDRLTAYSDRGIEFLPLNRVLRIYSEKQQVLAQTEDGNLHILRGRLYEFEERLAPHRFVRISNSEIVNARMITGMDFSLAGTICLFLRGNIKTYASRRYVSKIRKLFEV